MKAPWSLNSAVLVTPLSQNSVVLATPLSRFTDSFNQKAIQTSFKQTFNQNCLNYKITILLDYLNAREHFKGPKKSRAPQKPLERPQKVFFPHKKKIISRHIRIHGALI